MENLNGCSSHATWTVHWLLIDSNRNYPADVVGSLGTTASLSRPVIVILYRRFFSLFITSRLFLSRNTFSWLSPRDPRDDRRDIRLYSSHARIRRRLHLSALCIPSESVGRKCTLPFPNHLVDDRRSRVKGREIAMTALQAEQNSLFRV